MLVTAIIAAVILVVVRFFASRYLVDGTSSWAIGLIAVVIYALGLTTYPIYFEPSYVAAVPVTLPPSPPDVSHSVSCGGGSVVASDTTPGAIDSFAAGSGPSGPASGTQTIAPGSVVHLTGWIVTSAGPATNICAIVDHQVVAADILYGIQRRDVAASLNVPKDAPSGYVMTVKVDAQHGNHTLTIGAVAADGKTVKPVSVPAVSLAIK